MLLSYGQVPISRGIHTFRWWVKTSTSMQLEEYEIQYYAWKMQNYEGRFL